METIRNNSQQIISIVGTLLGTLLGWFLNNISKRGKLQFYTKTWENKFYGKEKNGYETIAASFEEANGYAYEAVIEVFNGSGMNKIVRDVNIEFSRAKKIRLSHKPFDKSTARFAAQRTKYDEFQYVNIPPKELRRLDIIGFVYATEVCLLKDIDTITMKKERRKE